MKVAAFYRFLDLDNPQAFRDRLLARCRAGGLLGTILVAGEGINGTLAGSESAIGDVLEFIARSLGLDTPIDARWSDASAAPFRRMRVKVKQEIVTLGRPDILPHRKTGQHVPPAEWNALIDDPDVRFA